MIDNNISRSRLVYENEKNITENMSSEWNAEWQTSLNLRIWAKTLLTSGMTCKEASTQIIGFVTCFWSSFLQD